MPYQVIQFEELPFHNIAKHVCVPESWIKWRDEVNKKVIVAYPVEHPEKTRVSVVHNENYSRDWKCYLAKAEFTAKSYTDAENFIKYLNRKTIREERQVRKKETSYDNSSEDVSEIAGGSSNRSLDETLVLPPEYDPNSPRWCLKYPRSYYNERQDLVDLSSGKPKTGIYVTRVGFEKCMAKSHDNNSLARNLMMEIFTESALRVCTLTGNGVERRPGLNDQAVNALVDTVLRLGYNDSDEARIRKCLSSKLSQMRTKL